MATRTRQLLFLLPLVLSSCGENEPAPAEYSFQDISSYSYRAFYSDSYFSGDSTKEDIRLASLGMSMSLAASPYRSAVYRGDTETVTGLYETCGMGNVYFSPAYFEPATPEATAFGAAYKTFEDGSNLVWAFIGSGTRDPEWTTNFELGAEGDAAGFIGAAHDVVEGISDYIIEQGIEGKTSLFVSGFSRCGGIANLVGGIFDDAMNGGDMNIGRANISFNRTYIYTIETPSASAKSNPDASKYANIHNYMNFNDAIPMLAPREWGFARLGQDHFYPDRLTDIHYEERRDKFLENLKDAMGSEMDYPDDTWHSSAYPELESYPSFGREMQSMVPDMAKNLIGSRAKYASDYQEAFGWLVSFAMTDGRSSYLMSSIRKRMITLMLHRKELTEILDLIEEGDFSTAEEKLLELCDALIDDEGKTVEILNYALPHIRPLFPMVQAFIKTTGLSDATAYFRTIGDIPPFHYRFSAALWIMTGDKQYGYNDKEWTSDGSYYGLHVSPCRNFTLSLHGGKNLLTCEDGKIVSSSVSASIKDGELVLLLPKNAEYDYKATDSTSIYLEDIDCFGTAETLKNRMASSGRF